MISGPMWHPDDTSFDDVTSCDTTSLMWVINEGLRAFQSQTANRSQDEFGFITHGHLRYSSQTPFHWHQASISLWPPNNNSIFRKIALKSGCFIGWAVAACVGLSSTFSA